MYAVIETGGKQYKVSEGMELAVEKLPKEENKSISLDKVLLLVDDKKELTIGKPYIEGMSVKVKILKQGRDRKVLVYKYKNKTGYHKKNGHRQSLSLIKIEQIGKGSPEKAAAKAEEKPKKAVKKTTAKKESK